MNDKITIQHEVANATWEFASENAALLLPHRIISKTENTLHLSWPDSDFLTGDEKEPAIALLANVPGLASKIQSALDAQKGSIGSQRTITIILISANHPVEQFSNPRTAADILRHIFC